MIDQSLTIARPWLENRHLRDLISSEAGALSVLPLRTDDIAYDAGWAGELYAPGATALDIGRGVKVRATGNVILRDGVWRVQHFNASRMDGRELTPNQGNRAVELINRLISEWAATHAGDIAQADDIDRNNGAHRLEQTIRKHEEALMTLHANLSACENGLPFSVYPDLPTDR